MCVNGWGAAWNQDATYEALIPNVNSAYHRVTEEVLFGLRSSTGHWPAMGATSSCCDKQEGQPPLEVIGAVQSEDEDRPAEVSRQGSHAARSEHVIEITPKRAESSLILPSRNLYSEFCPPHGKPRERIRGSLAVPFRCAPGWFSGSLLELS